MNQKKSIKPLSEKDIELTLRVIKEGIRIAGGSQNPQKTLREIHTYLAIGNKRVRLDTSSKVTAKSNIASVPDIHKIYFLRNSQLIIVTFKQGIFALKRINTFFRINFNGHFQSHGSDANGPENNWSWACSVTGTHGQPHEIRYERKKYYICEESLKEIVNIIRKTWAKEKEKPSVQVL